MALGFYITTRTPDTSETCFQTSLYQLTKQMIYTSLVHFASSPRTSSEGNETFATQIHVKTCTIKLTNFLDSVLTDPQYHFWRGSKNSGPSKVDGSFSEVFSFKGNWLSYVWYNKISKDPLEHFVTHGNLLLRVEIVNCLSVPLSNQNNWYCNSEENNLLPLEILPVHRERFFASGETNFEAMFSYEIISTDLALVIALKVGSGGKSFAAAFLPIPAVTEKKDLDALMEEKHWKTHEYKKNANANEGMQLISIRNIRAEILMSEEEKSLLKNRIFAV
ncbi:unnamed protein product [Allacma fusca]|uniref:Uncharacterized protein n=1 Tax=Allacma fusca TaxID=39272 RepID=A0A8J2PLH9_9HEXA|nr:unnamed protein product [Allacma fusca]